ncbi:GntR family transcriptional regulator [Streptomyces lasiicapitis]|uniref:GntR family transcriptional regulator n=1 Tax=Streptomyces lasiicapitis TaxID=1923961 RepID=UPI0036CEB036
MEFAANRPRWRQVHEVIVARIRAAEYEPGTKVPSVVMLTNEFGIANVTAQKVLRQLRADGLVYTEIGMGSFVVDELPPEPGE